jgi:hypothetical protein
VRCPENSFRKVGANVERAFRLIGECVETTRHQEVRWRDFFLWDPEETALFSWTRHAASFEHLTETQNRLGKLSK